LKKGKKEILLNIVLSMVVFSWLVGWLYPFEAVSFGTDDW